MDLLTQILNLHDISFTCGVLSRTMKVRDSCWPCSLHVVAKGYDRIIFKLQKWFSHLTFFMKRQQT